MKIYLHYATFDPHLSYYQVSHGWYRALTSRGVEVIPLAPGFFRSPGWFQRAAYGDIGATPTIVTATPDFFEDLTVGRGWIYTMWEGTVLPPSWAKAIVKRGERLILPSHWCETVFLEGMRRHGPRLGGEGDQNGPVQTIPVHVVPLGVDTGKYTYIDRGLGRRPYTFLCFADRATRKGWDVAWQAFYQAFGDNQKTPDVRIILKMTDRPGSPIYWITCVKDRRMTVWREDSIDLLDLYGLVDCLVYPTRGEGYGLPPREAAATGLPVICTDGGPLAPVQNWAIPLHYRMGKAIPPYDDGDWMLPDLDETAFWMRWCYENQEAAYSFGRRASEYVHDRFGWDVAADAMCTLLSENA